MSEKGTRRNRAVVEGVGMTGREDRVETKEDKQEREPRAKVRMSKIEVKCDSSATSDERVLGKIRAKWRGEVGLGRSGMRNIRNKQKR